MKRLMIALSLMSSAAWADKTPFAPFSYPITIQNPDILGGFTDVYVVQKNTRLLLNTVCAVGGNSKQGSVFLGGIPVVVAPAPTNAEPLKSTCQNFETSIAVEADTVVQCQGKACILSGYLQAVR